MAKSIGTILGEIFLAFKKGELDFNAINAETLGMSPEAYVGQQLGTMSAKKFENFINSFTPATDEQRLAKAEALKAIKENKKPFKKFRKDFAEASIDVSESTTKIASTSGANLGAGVVVEEQTPFISSEQDFKSQVPQPKSVLEQQAEASGLDTSVYEKYEKLGLIGNEQATIAYIAANPDLEDEDLEFLNAAASDAPLRPVERNGKTFLIPFAGHFTSVPLADIIDNYASSQEILNYQTFLMENNIVPQNYFASSMGEYSEELRTSIKVVMNWIDKNLYAEEGTDLFNEVNKGMESSPVYFQKTQELNGTFSYHRQLFNYGLQQMAQNAEQFDAAQEAEVARKMAQEYIPPADYVLDDMVEGAFEAKLGRKPTAEELDKWSTRFANSYSIAFAQNRAQAEKLQSFNFLTAQPELAGLTFEEAAELQAQYPGKGMVDLSVFSTVSPEEVRAKQFEDEFGNVIEARQTGAEVRKMQQDMLTYMFGS